MKLIRACLLCLGLTLCAAAYGDTITFDNFTSKGFDASPPPSPPDGYLGLTWNNLYVYNTSTFPKSGFVNGTVSPNNVLVSADYTQGTLGPPPPTTPPSISSATPFFLVSGDFTSAHQNGMSLEVIGFDGLTTEFDETFTLNVTGPSFLSFPSLPVTQLDFITSGGVDPGQGYLAGGDQMVVDNLTIAQVPDSASTALLLAASVGGLAVVRKRLS